MNLLALKKLGRENSKLFRILDLRGKLQFYEGYYHGVFSSVGVNALYLTILITQLG
jgi:hypothetical protein